MKKNKIVNEEIEKAKFEERVIDFWEDIDGIIALLNQTDPKHTNTTINSPQVIQFLLWRQLNELKLLRTVQKKALKEK